MPSWDCRFWIKHIKHSQIWIFKKCFNDTKHMGKKWKQGITTVFPILWAGSPILDLCMGLDKYFHMLSMSMYLPGSCLMSTSAIDPLFALCFLSKINIKRMWNSDLALGVVFSHLVFRSWGQLTKYKTWFSMFTQGVYFLVYSKQLEAIFMLLATVLILAGMESQELVRIYYQKVHYWVSQACMSAQMTVTYWC